MLTLTLTADEHEIALSLSLPLTRLAVVLRSSDGSRMILWSILRLRLRPMTFVFGSSGTSV